MRSVDEIVGTMPSKTLRECARSLHARGKREGLLQAADELERLVRDPDPQQLIESWIRRTRETA
jgi:hypothetical protein